MRVILFAFLLASGCSGERGKSLPKGAVPEFENVRRTIRQLYDSEPWNDQVQMHRRWKGKFAEIEVLPGQLVDVDKHANGIGGQIDVTQGDGYVARCLTFDDDGFMKRLTPRSKFLLRGKLDNAKEWPIRDGKPLSKMVFIFDCEIVILN